MRLLFSYNNYNEDLVELKYVYVENPGSNVIEKVYEIISINIYELIIHALLDNKRVFVPKTKSLMPLSESDIIIKEKESADPFHIKKDNYANLMRDKLATVYSAGEIITPLVEFVKSSFDLLDRGYFITSTNKNDIYYKIISDSTDKDDSDNLLKSLEKYLDSRNILEKKLERYSRLNKSIEELEYAETEEELDGVYNNFISDNT